MNWQIPATAISGLSGSKIDPDGFQKEERGYLGSFFFIVKNWKIKRGKFSNLTNRNAIKSRTKLQTEKHRQSAEFGRFPDNGKLQFNEQNYNRITNRNAIKSQTERKKREKEKKEAKKRIKSKRKMLKEVKNIYIL